MKKKDLYAFMRGLKMAKFEHPRSTYAVNKNKRLVEETIKDMEKAVEPSDEMKEFQKEREELAKTHGAKDEAGKPVLKKAPGMSPGSAQMIYDIPGQDDVKSNYRKALTKIEKKYNEEVDKHDSKVKKYNEEFLDEATEYKVFMIDLSFLEAHEKCPQPVMDQIWWMVKDDMEDLRNDLK